jgi:hypothetical protein
MVGQMGGGHRNEVLELRRGAQRLVARWSRRPAASLDWEVRLLEFLARRGIRVPVVVPALDGRRHVDGVVVMTWLEGRPPQFEDWRAVADTLRTVHELTVGWPQRPGSASTRQLLTAQRGGDVELSAMPADAVVACRRAWAALAGSAEAVVHGDPGPANIRISDSGVGLLDWDESRVDVADLDLAELPGPTSLRSGWPWCARPRPPGRPPTAGPWNRPTPAANSHSSGRADTPSAELSARTATHSSAALRVGRRASRAGAAGPRPRARIDAAGHMVPLAQP